MENTSDYLMLGLLLICMKYDKKVCYKVLDNRLINRRRRPGPNEACEVYEVDVPAEALTEEDEDILNYDDLDDPDAFV